jgi:hypothetical protein
MKIKFFLKIIYFERKYYAKGGDPIERKCMEFFWNFLKIIYFERKFSAKGGDQLKENAWNFFGKVLFTAE